ncbi:MAG TPA: aldolase/citrate lyase family protein [Candidatus Hydrogenedentes bacterium]|nr:aldolase/citrate lyase family protein [Candidatus Hydrogenedentota bacterium]
MTRAEFKTVCRERRLSWGVVMLEHLNPMMVRTFARAGYDWLWIDNEHAHQSYETIYEAARTAEDNGIISIVRVTSNDYSKIAQALDMAVDGIIVPRVETPEEVRHIIDCAKYPPIGKRGFGMRASLFGKYKANMRERADDQNKNRLLIIQLESPRAVDNIEKMIEVADGQLDGIFYGPADFQMAIGHPDTPDHPDVIAAARRITSLSAKHNLSNGLPATSVENARHWRDLGFNLITYKSDDQFIADAAYEGREALRSLES